jgi:hypothetical protein
MQQKLGEPGRVAVARRIARKIGNQRLEAPAQPASPTRGR